MNEILGGGFKYFLFSPLLGEDSHFDEHIFQMGGSTTNQNFSPKGPFFFLHFRNSIPMNYLSLGPEKTPRDQPTKRKPETGPFEGSFGC